MKRPAYVTLPGLSTVSILLNIPTVASLSDGSVPVIFVDTHDYQRLRGPTPLGEGQSAQKDEYLAMAYDDLRRRGIVRLVNYSELYPSEIQEQRLQQNRELVESIPDWLIRRAAVQGIEQWTEYGRGTYQDSFRETLGEDIDAFSNLRSGEKQLQQKIKRGTGNPKGWIEKMLNKNVAALEVCRSVDQNVDLDVRGVIASSEHQLSSDLLKASRSERNELSTSFLKDSYDLDASSSYLKQLDPHRRIVGLDSTIVSETRDIVEEVSTVATEMADAQHDDWTLFGLAFALPQYNDLFEYDVIRSQIKHQLDADTLAMQTEWIIEKVESESEEAISSNKLSYEADWIANQHDTLKSASEMRSRGLTDMVSHAVEIADHSRELRVLLEQNEVSQTAVFLAMSIMNNPFHRYEKDTVYRRSMDLMRRFDPPVSGTDRRFGWEREGATWTENEDWYESANRAR